MASNNLVELQSNARRALVEALYPLNIELAEDGQIHLGFPDSQTVQKAIDALKAIQEEESNRAN
jgi:hypothetical protein